ncbi:MAG: C-GCAxxG-C-C family protein, partial [Muribaculaceae bacterium]|nr:C-GCAxxG-C-C family protein [Muribaculaceae bacterium]
AVERKRSGKYNCAQSVACTYCGVAGVEAETMRHLTNAFGAGMGSADGTCGALVGAGVVLGMVRRDRAAAMRDMKSLVTRFKAQNGSVTCRELKGIDTGTPLRHCNDCVADAAALLEEQLSCAEGI